MKLLYHTLIEDLKARDYLGNLGVDGMIRLKSSTEKKAHIWGLWNEFS
jgi:hypothetical protein